MIIRKTGKEAANIKFQSQGKSFSQSEIKEKEQELNNQDTCQVSYCYPIMSPVPIPIFPTIPSQFLNTFDMKYGFACMMVPVNVPCFWQQNYLSSDSNCVCDLNANKEETLAPVHEVKEQELQTQIDGNYKELLTDHNKQINNTSEIEDNEENKHPQIYESKEEIKEVYENRRKRQISNGGKTKRKKLLRNKFVEELKTYNSRYYEYRRPSSLSKRIVYCKFENCNKSFKRVQNFVVHLRVHLEIRHYECKYCDKTFSQKGNLLKHVRKHEIPELSERKQLVCSECKNLYTQKYNLRVLKFRICCLFILIFQKIC